MCSQQQPAAELSRNMNGVRLFSLLSELLRACGMSEAWLNVLKGDSILARVASEKDVQVAVRAHPQADPGSVVPGDWPDYLAQSIQQSWLCADSPTCLPNLWQKW